MLTGETPYKGFDSLSVAYGVAVNTLSLPIPRTCPEAWGALMKSKFYSWYLYKKNIKQYYFTGCWELDPHKRPKFQDILKELEAIECSGFLLTPHDSFHTLQDGWKKEIAEVLEELKLKESVSF